MVVVSVAEGAISSSCCCKAWINQVQDLVSQVIIHISDFFLLSRKRLCSNDEVDPGRTCLRCQFDVVRRLAVGFGVSLLHQQIGNFNLHCSHFITHRIIH